MHGMVGQAHPVKVFGAVVVAVGARETEAVLAVENVNANGSSAADRLLVMVGDSSGCLMLRGDPQMGEVDAASPFQILYPPQPLQGRLH